MKTLLLSLVILLSFTAFGQPSSYLLTDSLVGWWPFNGNAIDESGNGNDGIITGGQFVPDRFGNPNGGIEFVSSAAGYVDIAASETPFYDEFSIVIWVKPDRNGNSVGESSACNGGVSVPMANSDQNWAMIPSNGGGSNLGVGLSLGQNGMKVAEHATNILVSRLSYTYSTTEFENLIIVYRTDSTFLYLNGNLVRSRPIYCPANPKRVNSSIRLGGSLYSPNFAGVIDEFGFWNRALDISEIELLSSGDYIGIEQLTNTKKELIKIIDFMGRETEFKPNTPLIFIYSDGTRERVMKIEE